MLPSKVILVVFSIKIKNTTYMRRLLTKYHDFRAKRRDEYQLFLAFARTWNQSSQLQLVPVRQET